MPGRENLSSYFNQIKPAAIIMFSRQLALLLESGIDIVASLELLQAQASNRNLKRVLGEVVSDLRGGNYLSQALSKHPKIFSSILVQSLRVGEQSAGFETILRQVADYMEKELTTAKSLNNALRYPIITVVVAFIMIAVMVIFVFPTFADLYSSLGVELPATTRVFLFITNWFSHYGPYAILALLIAAGLVFIYTRTPKGRPQWDRLALRLPIIGRANHLNQLARCCRSISLLFRAGLPLPEIMSLVTESSNLLFTPT